jgi:hypothetical protein
MGSDMSVRGWVYVIVNQAMPGLVKIGFSTKDPTLRALELDGTGAPHAYQVVYDALVLEPREIEQKAHEVVASYKEGKEWFRCSAAVAIEAIKRSTDKIYLETTHATIGGYSTAVGLSQKCSRDGCPASATKDYKGRPLCESHWLEDRRNRFGLVKTWDARKK